MSIFFYHLNLCLPLFLLVALGWALIKFRFFPQEYTKVLSGFTFRLLMPVMLFHLMSDLSNMPPIDPRVIAAFFGSCAIVYWLGRRTGRLFGEDNTGQTIFGMAAIFGNNVQLGVPIVQVSLGDKAIPTISILIIFTVLLLWTTAIASVEFGKTEGKKDFKKIFNSMLKVFQNPVVMGILAGSLWGLTGWQLPDWIDKTLGLVSTATTPVALMVVGMGLAAHSFSAALPKGLSMTALKVVIQPILVYTLARLIGLGELETQVVTVMAALPVAINIYMMAIEFKSSEGAASNAIFVSTLITAITVPITLTLLGVASNF